VPDVAITVIEIVIVVFHILVQPLVMRPQIHDLTIAGRVHARRRQCRDLCIRRQGHLVQGNRVCLEQVVRLHQWSGLGLQLQMQRRLGIGTIGVMLKEVLVAQG